MAGEARALLDSLMGAHRNEPIPGIRFAGLKGAGVITTNTDAALKKQKISCFDRKVCPYFTAWGVDMYELFKNTKSDLGSRGPGEGYVCDMDAHKEFAELPLLEQERLGYERMLLGRLRDLARMCDRTVSRNKEKLRQEIARNKKTELGDPVKSIPMEQVEQLAELNATYEEMAEKMHDDVIKLENLRNNIGTLVDGPEKEKARFEVAVMAEKVIMKLAELEPLKDAIANGTRTLQYFSANMQSDKTVCEISGNYMSSKDAEERIAAHFAGKQYVGWKLVRDKLKELDRKYAKLGPPPRLPPPDRYRDDRERGGYRERSRSSPGRRDRGGRDWEQRGPPSRRGDRGYRPSRW